MSDLTAKFEALEEQLDAADAATQAKLIAMQEALDLINAQLDTQTINNAANTRYLANALAQNNPCVDCGGTSLVVPPTDGTGVLPSVDTCKRVKAFLHAMGEVFTVLDVMSTFGVGFNTSIITEAFNEVIVALANSDTTPMPSFPEMVQIVGDGVSFIATNILVGHSLSELFSALVPDMIKPMFAGGSASGAQSAYDSIIDASDYSIWEKRLLQHSAYNELFSYYFDSGSTPNLAGYDGTTCETPLHSITECTVLTAVADNWGYGDYYLILPAIPHAYYFYAIPGDFYGWTFELLTGGGGGGVVFGHFESAGAESPTFTIIVDGIAHLFTDHSTALYIRTLYTPGGFIPFTVRVCPPV